MLCEHQARSLLGSLKDPGMRHLLQLWTWKGMRRAHAHPPARYKEAMGPRDCASETNWDF